MRGIIYLATTTPHDEECVQIGSDNYSEWSRLEAKCLIRQLLEKVGHSKEGGFLNIKSCDHDFGTYYDIAVYYLLDSADDEQWALEIENAIPEKWDEQSLKELKEAGYFSRNGNV
jgi:hypothetical protein